VGLSVETLRRPLSAAIKKRLAMDAVALLSANGLLLLFLVTDQLSPFELVLLVALEGGFFTLLAVVQSRIYPLPNRGRPSIPPIQTAGALLLSMIILGVLYLGVFASGLPAEAWPQASEVGSESTAIELPWWHQPRHFLTAPLSFLIDSSLRWPLLIVVCWGTADLVFDGFQRKTPGSNERNSRASESNALARWLTLFFGSIPLLLPLAVMFIAAAIHFRSGSDSVQAQVTINERNLYSQVGRMALMFLAILAPVCLFAVVGMWLALNLWMACFVAAKLSCEIFALVNSTFYRPVASFPAPPDPYASARVQTLK
jgi:hypothetical protein